MLDLRSGAGTESVPRRVQASRRHRNPQDAIKVLAAGNTDTESGEHRVARSVRFRGLHAGSRQLQVAAASARESRTVTAPDACSRSSAVSRSS